MKTDKYPLTVPLDLLAGEKLKSWSKAESRRCYQQPNSEFDALEHHLAGLPCPPPAAE